jgi:hypothetical protein
MFNEVHIITGSTTGMNLDRAWNDILFKIDRDKKFKKVEAVKKTPVSLETPEQGLQPNDEILSFRIGSKGQKVYTVIRYRQDPIYLYINKRTGLTISTRK